MCGICGIITFDGSTADRTALQRMNDTLAHRGPQSSGVWLNSDGNAGLGHRRLAIIDLSENGHQPLQIGERFCITFNGEIYNFREIRKSLEEKGHSFYSDTDTEVLLTAYITYGESCLEKLDGMFAFAIWDQQKKELFCARDRFGEKPFYYRYEPGKRFVFASEMKAIAAKEGGLTPDMSMLANFLVYGYPLNPFDPSKTFYRNVFSLPPATSLKIRGNNPPEIKTYWKIGENRINIRPGEAEEAIRDALTASVHLRLNADVAVGSCLSGGTDSSILVSIIKDKDRISSGKQETFSVIFPGFSLDEESYMRQLEKEKSLRAHYISPGNNYLSENIDRVFYHQEEPFPSASIVAQYAVMELAGSSQVTVLIDGQGADEMLGGYDWHKTVFLREQLRKGKSPEHSKNKTLWISSRFPGIYSSASTIRQKYFLNLAGKNKLMQWLTLRNPNLSGVCPDFLMDHRKELYVIPPYPPDLDAALRMDSSNYFLPSLLRYADRNSMCFSKEVRLPYLSHKFTDLCFSLPAELKINNGSGKFILKKAFEHLVPERILNRKVKIGFGAPQETWMKHLDRSHINESALKGIFKTSGNGDSATPVWEKLITSKFLSSPLLRTKG